MALLFGEALSRSPEETQISRIGKYGSSPMSTDPGAHPTGQFDPTSQSWPTGVGVFARGARIQLLVSVE
jgi:hypothetical protein